MMGSDPIRVCLGKVVHDLLHIVHTVLAPLLAPFPTIFRLRRRPQAIGRHTHYHAYHVFHIQ